MLIVDRDCQGLKNMLISKISKYHGLLYACPSITRLCHYTKDARLLEMGTSDEPLPSLPKVLFGFKFSQRYMNFISKKHFNFERKEGRKGMNTTIRCKSCLPWTRCGQKFENCLEILWMGIMASQINKPEN